MSAEERARAADRIFASRRDRAEREANLTTPAPEPTGPLVLIAIAANGTPQMTCADGVSPVDGVLLGMQGLGRLVLDMMAEETRPK